MPNFFIDRPIFAWVIAIIIMLAGGLAILKLPVAQYPTIAPPAVTISASYPGADAKTVQDTVTQVIEQNMNGIDNLMYMSSNSDSTGTVQITLTFESGTDADIAQVQVQNKLQLAMPLLPQEVQQQGVSVEKSSSSFLMVVGVINTDGTMTQEDISDYVAANMKDAISRTSGVGDVQLFGSQYAMRIWMNPNELNKFQLTPVDVITAIKAQNAQVAAGQLGGTPPVKGQQLNASIIAQTRLTSTEEFGKILLKVIRMVPACYCVMWRKLSWVVRTTTSSQSLTANRLPVWGSSWRPVRTRWIPLRQSVLNWRRWNRSSRRV
ncbi:acriflavin resistance protein B [Escherichia coli]|uniref:Acriflavin resistance protein B n=1 Tax=Escherichia coli TaxID=562 RepID=A0A377KAP4_ECOLX|nr:acriflavin resistance protein B [Escherichia coli]